MCNKLTNHLLVGIVVAVATFVSGCATNPQTGGLGMAPGVQAKFNSIFNNSDPCSNNDRNIGIAVGTVVGALLGYANHGEKGALIGATIGAGGGALLGHTQDQRRCNLYKIAQANNLKLASAAITNKKLGMASKHTKGNAAVGLDVQLQNKHDEFVPGTAHLTPKARA